MPEATCSGAQTGPIPRYVALTGPTASGKTAAALAVARVCPCEIISVDSALVYQGMDIGTAKPSPEERAAVPHHLIDIRDPAETYSAADFVRDAQRLILEIHARGRLPLLVGGTFLYLKALFEGLDPLPPAQPALRSALEAEAAALGWPALHAELARVDPDTAARLAPQDKQRIQRALEVYRSTGNTLSSLHTRRHQTPSVWFEACQLISLEPRDRSWLHQRIAQRFDHMLSAGLLDEVRALRARGTLHAQMPSMRCVGYRQAWEVLQGQLHPELLRDHGIYATRQLAKRQLTWLRSVPSRHQVACDTQDVEKAVSALVRPA